MTSNGDHRGMTRRASAASTNIPTSVSSSTTRVHKTNESTHGFVGTHPTNPGPTYSPSVDRTPQGKIVLSLINRLSDKLPYHSGLSLTDIEEDTAVLMILDSLIEMSKHALDVIVWKLAEELEKLRKCEINNKRGALAILQSEVFLLKVMAVTMAYRWQYRDRHDKRSHSSIGHANGNHVNGPAFASPAPSPSLNGTPKSSKRSRPGPTLSDRLASASPWLDAQPLNEALAMYLVAMMVMLLRQAGPRDDRAKAYRNVSPDATLYTFETIDSDDGAEARDGMPWAPVGGDHMHPSPTSSNGGSSRWPRKTPSLNSMSSGATSQLPIPRSLLAFKPTPRTLVTSSVPLHSLITEWASKIVYLLSAANWEQVRGKIRNRILLLSQRKVGDEPQDPTELNLLQYCALNRNRLSGMFNELSSLLPSMAAEAQAMVGQTLHRAIWNWIDNFPNEFIETATGQRKIEIAERFFDMLMSYTEDSIRNATWPALNALMIVNHDRLAQIEKNLDAWGPHSLKLHAKGQRKEIQFTEQLQKNISVDSKLTDISMLCCLDLLRSASYIPPNYRENPLYNLALESVTDFKNRLLKTRDKHPFYEVVDQIDVSLYSDAIAVLAHFVPLEEFHDFLGACLEPERSDAVKIVAVKSCITIIKEAPKTPWRKIAFSDHIRSRLARILQSVVSRQNELDAYGTMRRSALKPVVKRYTTEAISDRELLILSILSLNRLDPIFVMVEGMADDYKNRLRDLSHLIRHTGDPAIPLSTLRTFNSCADWILSLQPGDEHYRVGRRWLGTVIPIVLQASGSALLDTRDNLDDQRTCTQLSVSWVNYYGQCLDSEISDGWDFSAGRLPAMMVVEIALLVTLTSADTVVSTLAARGLRDLAIAECQPNTRRTVEEPENAAKRYPMYEQLGDPSIVVVGRVAYQKRIRKLLRLMQNPCPLHAAVWHECYWRWTILKDWIMHASSPISQSPTEKEKKSKPQGDLTMSDEEKFFQWQNLTWFLSSFGAISVIEDCGCVALTSVMPMQFIPDRLRIQVDGDQMIQDFMSSSMEVLIASNPVARDTAKEALGSELNPRLYGRLFKHLNEVIDDIAPSTKGSRVEAGDELLLVFFDQFLTVLKLLVDRPDAPSEDVLGNMDLNQTLLSMARLMDSLNQDTCFRLRAKFCGFCESALARADAFGLRKDDVVRNSLLEVIVEWIEPNAALMAKISNPALFPLRHDANVAGLRAMVKLLERLRLQPLDISAGDDATNAVSRRYLKYQQRFIEMLATSSTGILEEESKAYDSSENLPLLSEKRSDIRDMIINGLANLLSMNIDIGLKHFMPLSDDPDPGKRAIFCKVVSRVMDLGGKIETNSYSTVANRRTKIGELVKGSDMILVLSICETCPPAEVDIIIPVLLNLFDTRSSLLSLLRLLVEREVKTTQHESNLFRGNSMRMKLLCAFAKHHGYDYLRFLVKPFLERMCQCTTDYSFMLDPTRASEDELKQNRSAVEFWTEAFLQIVCQSANAMPLMLREISAHISQTVAEVWPDAKFAALGAFIFLRFISPALVSPETIDIELPQDSVLTTRRGLLHITKIIQNLANNVRFGKEAHMVPFNAFLTNHIVPVMRFLTELSDTGGSVEEGDDWIGGSFDETDAIVLHRFFEKHADKVGKELLSLSKTSKDGEAAVIGGKKAWDTLCAALVEMGQPVEVPKLSPLASTTFEEYRDFMFRNADRDTEIVQNIFTSVTVKKDGNMLYLMSIWKLDVEVLDFELLIYHVFKTLMSAGHDDKSFEIIVDCTNYTTMSEIPMQWFKFFLETTPSDMRERFKMLHILNCNQHMAKFLRKLYNICSGIFHIDVRSYLSISDLYSSLEVDVTEALQEAWSLEQEDKEEFKNVMLRQAHLMKTSVHIAVAQSHLRIDHVKAQFVYPSFMCKTTEIVPYADVGDVYNVSTGRDVHEFIVRRNRNGGTLYFSSSEREHVVKAIRLSKSRMNVSRTMFFDRFSRLSNVSAVLLNIAMFNAFADSLDLRGAAYNLLTSVCSSIKYDGELFLPSGGFIPGSPVTIITQLSEKLAAFAPELTLDFITQVCVELVKTTVLRKAICLQYMNPWVKNLNKFCDPTDKLYELSGARLRDCIKNIIEVTVQDKDAYYILQRYTWAEVGKLDIGVMNIIVDEMMRTGSDGGIGSDKCEIMAETLSSMCSARVRGKILAKLRKALGKTCTKPSRTLETNVHWNEISAYARLALGSGLYLQQTAHCQLLVPEVIHLVTLLASQGDVDVRCTIYGLALQTFQSMYMASSEDSSRSPEVRSLLHDLQQPEIIRLFGLEKTSASSPTYVAFKNADDDLSSLEQLSRWLLRAVETCAGNSGLANIWRARWMGLLTSTAFQLSPSVQPRAFIVMGTLASSDVDDDLLYQMLVALRNALRQSDEADTQCVVSMLHCVCTVVSTLAENSRYIAPLFWLAVALLQSSHAPFFIEANKLLCACITTLNRHEAFKERGFVATLLEARTHLEDISLQLDEMLGLSFDSDFSFSLAAIIFKGTRRPSFRSSATDTLRCLLKTVVSTLPPSTEAEASINSDALGYVLALLPTSTTPQAFKQLLLDSGAGVAWARKDSFERAEIDDGQVPCVPFEVLGCQDQTTALLIVSFVGSMLSTAQNDDPESQMLFGILKDMSSVFPDIVSMAYDGLLLKIHEIFSKSSNPSILSSVSTIFRVSMEDTTRPIPTKESTSTLGTLDEESAYGQRQTHALTALQMHGLAKTLQFIPLNQGYVRIVLHWFPDLISRIID